MYYLKYRPQTINEIDLQDVASEITAILGKKTIPHALLLTGQKGIGKTSVARIITKAINCEKNRFAEKSESIEPCNLCYSCKTITSGQNLDCLEIDAATNRKIDEMRDLIDKVKFLPLKARYKVYIIDEVHMLTKEAFNALLKTLEEPPSKTIFILATTEIDKMPKTIVSRCLHINFPKAKDVHIIHMLKRIIKNEKITAPDDVLVTIAQNSDNSFRDATKILEQAVISNRLTIDGIHETIGFKLLDQDLLLLISEQKIKEILINLEMYEKKGGQFKPLIEYYLNRLHLLLLFKKGLDSPETKDYNLSISQITKLIKLFSEAYRNLKYTPIESLPLELAIMDFFS